MRRALEGKLPGPLPIGQGLSMRASGGIVLRYQGRLRRSGLGEALGQHLGNALVVLLPGALGPSLVGGVFMNQRVLKLIHGGGAHAPLVEQLRIHKLFKGPDARGVLVSSGVTARRRAAGKFPAYSGTPVGPCFSRVPADRAGPLRNPAASRELAISGTVLSDAVHGLSGRASAARPARTW